MKNILTLCAENALIKGAKVGGVADVIAGVSPALRDQGCKVQIVMPSYGVFHAQVDAKLVDTVYFPFYGQHLQAQLYFADNAAVGNIPTWFVHHAIFNNADVRGKIYIHDDDKNPFASDATRFALFCAATAEIIKVGLIHSFQYIHLHDWQGAFLLFLKNFEPHYQRQLGAFKYIYSIHNLGYQGIRPLDNHASSLKAWWPHLHVIDQRVRDPHYTDCFNPMALAIRFADKLHAVSPTYAKEILKASDHEKGYYGGEGLQQDIQMRAINGDLVGILNGCVYDEKNKFVKQNKQAIFKQAYAFSLRNGPKKTAADELLYERLIAMQTSKQLSKLDNQFICASVGRLSTQKIALLLQPISKQHHALDMMLMKLGEAGKFCLVGSGDEDIEQQLLDTAKRHSNFLFINAYAQDVADLLYAQGDLFVMPSQYEPCGISQMFAMRNGQPCLVHATGGLKDTVTDNVDGFRFTGDSPKAQAKKFITRFEQALTLFQTDKKAWVAMCENARKKRFLWSHTASEYCHKLYT